MISYAEKKEYFGLLQTCCEFLLRLDHPSLNPPLPDPQSPLPDPQPLLNPYPPDPMPPPGPPS